MTKTGLGANDLLRVGMESHRVGDLAAAEKYYRATLAQQPDHPDALHLLGTVRESLGDVDQGIALIQRALQMFPALADAHFNLGNIYLRQHRIDAAAQHFQRAVDLKPANARNLANLGGVLTQLERYEDAERYTRKALQLDPDMIQAACNLAALHEIRGRFAKTLPLYDALLRKFPNDAEIHYLRALALLLRGQLSEGWDAFRWRLQRPQTAGFHGRFRIPYWRGEPLHGRRILIWTEQGLGDEILLGTMLADAVHAAGKVILIASERMAPLFADAFPSAIVLAADDKPKDASLFTDINYQASLSELGRWLRPSFASFPGAAGYLKPDPALAAGLRQNYLQDKPGTRLIGLSWRSKNADLEAEKSMTLDVLTQILRLKGFTFVSLQYGECAAEISAFNRRARVSLIHDRSIDPVRDVGRFAAQVAAMDLIVSVSNTTVHMGGALGRPTWAMIPANRGRAWYWFLDRDDSPWYPSVRLVRRAADENWEPVIDRIVRQLTNFAVGNAPA